MCGISGYFGSKIIEKNIINKTMNLMISRGPDNQSYYLKKFLNRNIVLIHSRLSILDINDRSNQPIRYGKYIMVFNGEIYNYIELKKYLEKRGYNFSTKSDTEVLIKLYDLHKQNFFELLEGMWSFAIFDTENLNLILSRDRFGEKPLHILKTQDGVYFGSETKFLEALSNNKQPINENKILNYLSYGYNSVSLDTKSFKKNIHALKPASVLTIKDDLSIKEKKYWNLKKNLKNNNKINKKEIYEEVRYKIIKGLKIRLRSDVKNIFCLSGGIDSGSIVSIAAKKFNLNVNTFSIIDTLSQKYNEKHLIEHTLRDTGANKNYLFTEKIKIFDNIEKIIEYYNAPVLTINYLLHALMQKQIKELGYKVVLSGNGADEIFAGYYDHYLYHLKDLKDNYSEVIFKANYLKWQKHLFPIIRNNDYKNFLSYYRNSKIVTLKPEFKNMIKVKSDLKSKYINIYNSDLKNKMLSQLPERLYPVLFMDDLNSMMNSIENRTPFLDKDLIEYLFSLPSEIFINNAYSKNILRESMKGILNDKIRKARRKYGFNASLSSFSDFNKKNYIDYLFDNINHIKKMINTEKLYKFIKNSDFEYMTDINNKFFFRLLSVTAFLNVNKHKI